MSVRPSQFRPATRLVAAASIAALTGGLLVAGAGASQAAPGAPAAPSVGTASTAVQDHDRRGTCGAGARYDADVERDDGRLEISFEIDGANAGDRYKIKMSQNGDRFLKETRSLDNERELDIESNRADTAGIDTFKLTAKKVGGGGKCSVTLTR